MRKIRLICFLAVLVLAFSFCMSAMALSSSTLSVGSRGEEVRKLQQALIDLGYLKGKADGIFGNQTYKAVVAFQHAKKLTEDGLAGKKTQAAVYEAASGQSSQASQASAQTETVSASASSSSEASSSASASSSAETSSSSSSSSAGGLFSGNYATLRLKDRGDRVKILQQALIRLNYLSGSADGIFGNKTLEAVKAFQKASSLTADGLAGKKTLKALETADRNGAVRSSSSSNSSSSSSAAASSSQASAAQEESAPAASSGSSSSGSPSSGTSLTAPDGGTLKLLHWYNDVKPTIGGGSKLLVYDPSSKISWTLRVHSCGRHCDAEPLTAEDTSKMLQAFGGVNTWDQKGVYVKLPSGVWTVASTHDNPHMTGKITDNNFDGHLCVHFLRDMSEAKQNDPKYGVANQETIRALWKSLTGETLEN